MRPILAPRIFAPILWKVPAVANLLTNTTLTRKNRLAELKRREAGYFDLAFLKAMPADHRNTCFDHLDVSKSQLRQDLFGLVQAEFKREGFFLEFGATDGVALNNTWLMEKHFGWRGILAEPARGWQAELKVNRDCILDRRCVWKRTGETLDFSEAPRGENSGLSAFMKQSRKRRSKTYQVQTVALNDLLSDHAAPDFIDFASIDTEGSEFEILSAFDFDRWRFGALCIEHNYAAQRDDLHRLLTAHGYMRVHEQVSRFDDWYIPASS